MFLPYNRKTIPSMEVRVRSTSRCLLLFKASITALSTSLCAIFLSGTISMMKVTITLPLVISVMVIRIFPESINALNEGGKLFIICKSGRFEIIFFVLHNIQNNLFIISSNKCWISDCQQPKVWP